MNKENVDKAVFTPLRQWDKVNNKEYYDKENVYLEICEVIDALLIGEPKKEEEKNEICYCI